MKLTKLQLENFRNYQNYTYNFSNDKKCTILVGENGQGKTNFLEAIYVLSLGRSFRSLDQENLVQWDSDFMRCQAEIFEEDDTTELEVFYSKTPRRQKNFKKNGVNMRNSEYIGNLLVVLFHPEDLNLLYLTPTLRRNYLDILLSQADKKYLYALSNYKKVLKQRNALLHMIREGRSQDLDSWNVQLVDYGEQIIKTRKDFIDFLSDKIEEIYQSISEGNEKVTVEYSCKVDLENIHKDFFQQLEIRSERDIRQAQTTCGPHRDDMVFYINGTEICQSASRGEFRTLLLAIKFVEIKYIEKLTGKKPLLLLDDVFSELDLQRQKHLLNAIEGCQTIITTTDLVGLDKISHESEILNVNV